MHTSDSLAAKVGAGTAGRPRRVTDAGQVTFFDGAAGLGPLAGDGFAVEAGTPGIVGARDSHGALGFSLRG